MQLEVNRGTTTYTIDLDLAQGVIGRNPNAQIRIPFPTISSSHLEFEKRGAVYFVRDLASTNGTKLGGKTLTAFEWIKIDGNTQFKVLDITITFRPHALKLSNFTLADSGTFARKLLLDGLGVKGEDAYICALNGPEEGQRVTLADGVKSLAFGSSSLSFTFPTTESPIIATIKRDGEGFAIVPQEPILINGQSRDSKQNLRHKNRIEMGGIQFQFFDPLESYFDKLNPERDLSEGTEAHEEAPPNERITPEQLDQKYPELAEIKLKPTLREIGEDQPDVAVPKREEKKGYKALLFAALALLLVLIGLAAIGMVLMI